MKIVVLSPHRGDAAFSVGLSIDAWIKAGHKVQVLNCFSRSVYAPHAETEFVHSNDMLNFVTALRAREDEAWRKLCGSALGLVDLNMKDASRRLHKRVDEVYGLEFDPADGAIEKIRKAVEKADGGALVVPAGLGGHVDHLLVKKALEERVAGALPCALYEELPEAEGDSSDIEVAVRRVDGGLTPAFVGGLDDVDAAVKRKRRLALCYDSQVDDATVERMANFCVKYEGRERLWANAAWLAGGL